MDLAYPWMLFGMLGLPALAAIYWLRSRSRLRVVSSLIFWSDQRRPRQGGLILQRLQTPLVFFLEMLAIAAIVLAAAGPSVTRSRFIRPIVVVLDDSYSMEAGADDSPRHRGSQALADELRGTEYIAHFILAGTRPRLLGDSVRSAGTLRNVLDQWTCAAPTAVLEQAVAMAAEVGGPEARILVISDHAPSSDLPKGKVQWRAYGRALGNIAFTAASRDTSLGGKKGPEDRVLLEVTNLGQAPARTHMVLQGANLTSPRQSQLELEPGATSRFFLDLPWGSPPLHAKLDDDVLAIDNEVVLASPRHRLLRVQLIIADAGSAGGGLRAPLVRALEACGQVTFVERRPDLVITDGPFVQADAWQLQILGGPEPVSFEGPFVLDRSHPLAEGLSLEAVIWTATGKAAPVGAPVITAGNTVLLTDREDAMGQHKLQIALDPKLSNLTDNPDWPILVANLVRWRLAALPGCVLTNVRLDQSVQITLAAETATSEAVVVLPGGTEQVLPVHGKQIEVRPDHIGLHKVRIGPTEYEFACNALSPDESNLTACTSGQWGDWNQSQLFQDQRMSLSWIFVLMAIGFLAIHMELLYRTGGSEA